jgi:hypothetical protein
LTNLSTLVLFATNLAYSRLTRCVMCAIFGVLTATSALAQAEKCLDIAVKSVRLLEIKSKTVVIEVTLENTGLRTIDLPNKEALALQYYWSGDPNYNSGDRFIAGMYIENFGDYGKSLSPDGTYTITLNVPIGHKTHFENYFVILADNFYFYDECNENNNSGSVSVIIP